MRTEKLTLNDKWEILHFLFDFTPISEISKMYNISRISIWRLYKKHKKNGLDMYKCKNCHNIEKFDKEWGKRTPYMYGNMCLKCLNENNKRYIDEQNKWLSQGSEKEKDEKLCQIYMETGFFNKKEDWENFKRWLDRQ